eukprot:CAMPEP_0185725718 /NCGR_PEP_ID=MMETSP1171-20130828/1908_1 /TAXON_ID=374046 /ORGANISM="Helicotheca tamensis, Strain CCMP826" /LENGTH=223 /DNA_ID=CAMNT_0028393911 /DNA_START=61 /DNA_END=732 /DNA_ORIENTATION=+
MMASTLVLFLLIAPANAFIAPSSPRDHRTFIAGANVKSSSALNMGIADSLKSLLGLGGQTFPEPCVMGDESIMSQKSHGTSDTPVQKDLRWACDYDTADRICNFNRHYAEFRGYWATTPFLKEAREQFDAEGEITFYDSNTGKPLFVAPKGRTFEEFAAESKSHGWPSFRDEEVVWENVRCLPDGEAVSVDGTHLGHNLPDFSGSRYCINLVSVAGKPQEVDA